MSGALARVHMVNSRSRARLRMLMSASFRLAVMLLWCLPVQQLPVRTACTTTDHGGCTLADSNDHTS